MRDGLRALSGDRHRGGVVFVDAATVDAVAFVDAVRRHAPHLPVAVGDRLDTGGMSDAVSRARVIARAGDTVLLAPAADLDPGAGSELGELSRTVVVRQAAGGGA